MKANYWLTGEPNTKGNLYIDLGCVVEVDHFESQYLKDVIFVWDSFSARKPFWEELKEVSHAGGWISSEKHTQPHLEWLFHQKGKFKKKNRNHDILFDQFRVWLRDWEFEFPRNSHKNQVLQKYLYLDQTNKKQIL